MNSNLLIALIVTMVAGHQCAVIDPIRIQVLGKVFNYQGSLPPIKDDRTGDIIREDTIETIETNSANETSEAEKLCWDLIVEQSEVTFALQNRVLDELTKDLKDLDMDPKMREAVESLIKKMKADMQDGLNALKDESPEDYFDALFNTNDDIVQLSHIVRNPKLDEKVFLVLVKALSRLGRNNSMFIQEFIDQCSVYNKSPRPRSFFSF